MRLDLLVEDERWCAALAMPPLRFARRALKAACEAEARDAAVSVLMADDARLRALNKSFRGKDSATNVLAFPAPASAVLGDIALAYETVAGEAVAQGKPFPAHAAHLLVHGFLHLLGYDHVEARAAARMEARERVILENLGWPDPYA